MQVLVFDGGPDGPVVGELNADDSITVVRELAQAQPEHGQVSVFVDDVHHHIVYSDHRLAEYTLEREGVRERVRFTGRRVCGRCLSHHDREDCS